MSFSQSSITSVNPPVQYGTQLLLSWTSIAPVGTIYQVYLNQQLVWSGVGLSCSIPLPTAIARIDIGTVEVGESQIPFSAELPSSPARQVTLSWLGGTFLGVDIAGFHIYGEAYPRCWYRLHDGALDSASVCRRNHYRRLWLRRIRPGRIWPVGRHILLDLSAALGGHLELGRQTVRYRRQRRTGPDRRRHDRRAAVAARTISGHDPVELHVQQHNETSYVGLERLSIIGRCRWSVVGLVLPPRRLWTLER